MVGEQNVEKRHCKILIDLLEKCISLMVQFHPWSKLYLYLYVIVYEQVLNKGGKI